MMRAWIALLLLFAATAQAQPPNLAGLQQQRIAQADPDGLLWARASAIGDWHTAIGALHRLLQHDSLNTIYQDSIAALYLRTGQEDACLAFCTQALRQRPDALFLHRAVSGVLSRKGRNLEAVHHLERIATLGGHPFDRYQLLATQFLLGRHAECQSGLDALLQDPSAANIPIQLTWQGGQGTVPMIAALHNVQGNLHQALGRKKEARASYQEALRLSPAFGLAENNLKALRKR